MEKILRTKSYTFALRIVENSSYLSLTEYESINKDYVELIRLLASTVKTLKESLKRQLKTER